MGSSIKCLTVTIQLLSSRWYLWLVQKAICFTPQGKLNKLPIEEAHPYKLGRKVFFQMHVIIIVCKIKVSFGFLTERIKTNQLIIDKRREMMSKANIYNFHHSPTKRSQEKKKIVTFSSDSSRLGNNQAFKSHKATNIQKTTFQKFTKFSSRI